MQILKMTSVQPSENSRPLSDIPADEIQLELGLLKKKMRIVENDKVVLENSNRNSQSQLTLARTKSTWL